MKIAQKDKDKQAQEVEGEKLQQRDRVMRGRRKRWQMLRPRRSSRKNCPLTTICSFWTLSKKLSRLASLAARFARGSLHSRLAHLQVIIDKFENLEVHGPATAKEGSLLEERLCLGHLLEERKVYHLLLLVHEIESLADENRE